MDRWWPLAAVRPGGKGGGHKPGTAGRCTCIQRRALGGGASLRRAYRTPGTYGEAPGVQACQEGCTESGAQNEKDRDMARKGLLIGTGAVVLAAGGIAGGLAATSGPSYPHSWCGPLIAQFHAHETRQAYEARLAAVQRLGAPVGKLIADETTYGQDEAATNSPGTAGYSAVLAATGAIGAVSADLQQLNADCGQPADAYKTDNA